MSVKTRTLWIDYAKAIGIILVVFGHVLIGLYNANIQINNILYTQIINIIYSFHMPLFFFLSGLFFYNSLLKYGKIGLIKYKVKSILLVYILWSLVQGLIEVVLSNYTTGNVTFIEVLSLWQPRAQFWFLYYMFVYFILFSFIYSFFKIEKTKYIIIMFLILFLLFDNRFLNYAIYFVMAIYISQLDYLKYKIFINKNLELFTWFSLFAIFQYSLFELNFNYKHNNILVLVTTFISIIFIVKLSLHLSINYIKTLSYLGKNSLAIYILHILSLGGVRIVLQKVLQTNDPIIHIILGTSLSLIFPLVALEIMKKYNINLLLHKKESKYENN